MYLYYIIRKMGTHITIAELVIISVAGIFIYAVLGAAYDMKWNKK
jgi:hypothetical protein